jgi:hypothetical protein
MDDVLVHRPAFQGVKVLIPPFVSFGIKCCFTLSTLVQGCYTVDNLSPDASLREPKIVCHLDVLLHFGAGDVTSVASGAFIGSYLDLTVRSKFSCPLPRLFGTGAPNRFASAEEDLFSLIVKIGGAPG